MNAETSAGGSAAAGMMRQFSAEDLARSGRNCRQDGRIIRAVDVDQVSDRACILSSGPAGPGLRENLTPFRTKQTPAHR